MTLPLRLLFYLCFAVCALAQPKPWWPNVDRPQSHRRPPPPFDIKPQWRLPWPRSQGVLVSSPPEEEDGETLTWRNPWPRQPAARVTAGTPAPIEGTLTDSPIVLYKRDCDPCMPGWGVKSPCNDTSNTVCKPCPLGTWSPQRPHFRPCLPCTKCGSGSFEEVTCVSTRDTKCGSCSNHRPKITEDFIRKCDWGPLHGEIDPNDLVDPDDTLFELELELDMKSKELADIANADVSIEFGNNDEDLDRFLRLSSGTAGEQDITIDDPEIDLDQPSGNKEDDDQDISKEIATEWGRLRDRRHDPIDEEVDISKRFEDGRQAQLRDAADLDDNEGDTESGPRRLLLHPIRPLPQMVPVPEKTIHVEEDDVVVQNETPVENNFPPSYHNYPIDALLHAGEAQRRKAIVLLVLTCAIILATIGFIACYIREYCRRRVTSYNRVVVVNLSPEEREIVRQSANALAHMQKPVKKTRGGNRGYSVLDEDAEIGVYVTENPLEAYLNATDDRLVAQEGLLENEVLERPVVHRRTDA